MKIIFRSCALIEQLSPLTRRPFDLKKEDVSLISFVSLLESCKETENKIDIEIVDDSSPDAHIKKLEKVIDNYKNNNIKIKLNRFYFKNNGKSLEQSYFIAEKTNEKIIYFCEDDYIHLKPAIKDILEVYENKPFKLQDFSVFPCDYPTFYENYYPSFIFVSKSRHWRSIKNTTGTFFTTKKIFNKYKEYFFAFAEYNKDGRGGEEYTLNRIWEKSPLISPIETLATHFHTATLSPFIDWYKIIGLYKNKINDYSGK